MTTDSYITAQYLKLVGPDFWRPSALNTRPQGQVHFSVIFLSVTLLLSCAFLNTSIVNIVNVPL